MPLLGNQPVRRNLSGEMTVSLPFPNYSEQFYLPTSCTAQNYNVKIKVWMKLIFFLQIRQVKLNAWRQNNCKLLCYATMLLY